MEQAKFHLQGEDLHLDIVGELEGAAWIGQCRMAMWHSKDVRPSMQDIFLFRVPQRLTEDPIIDPENKTNDNGLFQSLFEIKRIDGNYEIVDQQAFKRAIISACSSKGLHQEVFFPLKTISHRIVVEPLYQAMVATGTIRLLTK